MEESSLTMAAGRQLASLIIVCVWLWLIHAGLHCYRIVVFSNVFRVLKVAFTPIHFGAEVGKYAGHAANPF